MSDNLGRFTTSTDFTPAVAGSGTGDGRGRNGVYGTTTSSADSAVYGEHTASGIGVFGRGGPKVGEQTGTGIGVFGQGGLEGGEGVFGQSHLDSNGVTGISPGGGSGVFGAGAIGVQGQATPGDPGTLGKPGVYGGGDIGVSGYSAPPNGIGVMGQADGRSGIGVSGFATYAGEVTGPGQFLGPNGVGVQGNANTGVQGICDGGFAGVSARATGNAYGVYATAFGSGTAIVAQNKGYGIGLQALTAFRAGEGDPGASGPAAGNWAFSAACTLVALSNPASGAPEADILTRVSLASGNTAAEFKGPVHFEGAVTVKGPVTLTGPIQKPGGGFLIDHPTHPAHKYLRHSFVESPDMKNVYDGEVIIDDRGGAEVLLPNYFELINMDFRYQLTAIGAAGPNLHVSREITNNRFRIAGGVPGMKVCWQVTGCRRDPWAAAHRIQVEDDKTPGERGHYLHPELYGQPPEKSLTRAHQLERETRRHLGRKA